MLMQPYWSYEVDLHYPLSLLPVNILTTSQALGRYLEILERERKLEHLSKTILTKCAEEGSNLLTLPLEIIPEDALGHESGENACLMPILASLSTCAGLARLHMSVIDDLYVPLYEASEEQYYSQTITREPAIITITTLSRRIGEVLNRYVSRGIIDAWLDMVYPELQHPMSIALDPKTLPDTPIIVTKCARTDEGCDVLHAATVDAIALN